MLALLFGFAASFFLCLILTPIARQVALRCGLVDHPDDHRKMHAHPVPVAGGLPILLSLLGGGLAAWLTGEPTPEPLFRDRGLVLIGLVVASLLLAVLGTADDLGRLRGRHKLVGQIVAALVLVGFGVQVREVGLFEWTIDLGLLAIPFTVCFLLGAINSLNLIDGMDGLLSSVGLIISLAMAVMASMTGHWADACVAVALAGALLGFLRYNFPPAKIFLGDSGSMVIGVIIGTLAIQTSLKATATAALVAPAALLAPTALLTIPFFDTFVAIVRRKLTGRSLYSTDRGHLHHCLLQRGFSVPWALALVAGFCLLTVAGAIASLAFKNELLAVLSALAVMSIMVTTRLFGYAEFSLLRKRIQAFALSFVRVRNPSGGRQMQVRLQGTVEWVELWNAIIVCARKLNLVTVRLDVNAPALDEGYHARWDRVYEESEQQTLWRTEIPLVADGRTIGRLEVAGRPDWEPVSQKITELAGMLEHFESHASLLALRSPKSTPINPPKSDVFLLNGDQLPAN